MLRPDVIGVPQERPAPARWQPSLLARLLRRRVVFWATALALAAFTVAMVANITGDAERRRDAWGDTAEVLVVARAVPAGEPVAAAVALEVRPLAVVPDGAVGDIAPDAVAATALVPGEVLVASRLRGPTDGLIGPGQLGVAIPVSPALPAVDIGTPISVVALPDPLVGGPATTVSGTVVAADTERITVAIPAADVATVAAALASGNATLTLAPVP